MYLICCIDDRLGMTFAKRRVSRDRILILDILSLIKERGMDKIIMENYSYELFQDALSLEKSCCDDIGLVRESKSGIEFVLAEEPLEEANSGDYCFDERFAPTRYTDKIEEIILYKWNRAYPATVHFDINLDDGHWNKVESKEFFGNSHDNITREIWRKAL